MVIGVKMFKIVKMACKNCKYFRKMRNLSFGRCHNDEAFQYAIDRDDLEGISSSALIIMGEGITIVGVDYECPHFSYRGQKEMVILTSATDSSERSFVPPASRRRENNLRRERRGHSS